MLQFYIIVSACRSLARCKPCLHCIAKWYHLRSNVLWEHEMLKIIVWYNGGPQIWMLMFHDHSICHRRRASNWWCVVFAAAAADIEMDIVLNVIIFCIMFCQVISVLVLWYINQPYYISGGMMWVESYTKKSVMRILSRTNVCLWMRQFHFY